MPRTRNRADNPRTATPQDRGLAGGIDPGGTIILNECCDQSFRTGRHSAFGLQWADKYRIRSRLSTFNNIELTYQGLYDGGPAIYWESALIESTCDAGTDEYRVIQIVEGNGVGQITTRKFMETGGASGQAACCPSTSTGTVQEYKNPHIITDPLSGFRSYRNQTAMDGLECQSAPCSLCTLPIGGTFVCGDCEFAKVQQVSIDFGGNYLDEFSGEYLLLNKTSESCRWRYDFNEYDPSSSPSPTVITIDGFSNVYSEVDPTKYLNAFSLDLEVFAGDPNEFEVQLQMNMQKIGVPGYYAVAVYETLNAARTSVVYHECAELVMLEEPVTLLLNAVVDYTGGNWPEAGWPDQITITPHKDLFA